MAWRKISFGVRVITRQCGHQSVEMVAMVATIMSQLKWATSQLGTPYSKWDGCRCANGDDVFRRYACAVALMLQAGRGAYTAPEWSQRIAYLPRGDGELHGEDAGNVIPRRVDDDDALRTFFSEVITVTRRVVCGISASTFRRGYPSGFLTQFDVRK